MLTTNDQPNPRVMLVSDAEDEALLAFRERLAAAALRVEQVPDVYTAAARLASGDFAAVTVDIRLLVDAEMQFLRLAARYFPNIRILVPDLGGSRARRAAAGDSVELLAVAAVMDALAQLEPAVAESRTAESLAPAAPPASTPKEPAAPAAEATAPPASAAETMTPESPAAPASIETAAPIEPAPTDPAPVESFTDEPSPPDAIPHDYAVEPRSVDQPADHRDGANGKGAGGDIEADAVGAEKNTAAVVDPEEVVLDASDDSPAPDADPSPSMHDAVRMRMAHGRTGPVRRLPPGQAAAAPEGPDDLAVSAEEMDALLGEQENPSPGTGRDNGGRA